MCRWETQSAPLPPRRRPPLPFHLVAATSGDVFDRKYRSQAGTAATSRFGHRGAEHQRPAAFYRIPETSSLCLCPSSTARWLCCSGRVTELFLSATGTHKPAAHHSLLSNDFLFNFLLTNVCFLQNAMRGDACAIWAAEPIAPT